MIRLGEAKLRRDIRFCCRAIDDTERMIAGNEKQIERYGDRHGHLSSANKGLIELLEHYKERLDDVLFELEVI